MNVALHWLCAAITKGNPRALNNLAHLYMQADGVPYDLDEARSLWRQAIAVGHINAMYNLGASLYRMPVKPGDKEEGYALILRAALLGHPGAIAVLRAAGYRGALPDPVDPSGRMELAPQNAPAGHAKVCTTS